MSPASFADPQLRLNPQARITESRFTTGTDVQASLSPLEAVPPGGSFSTVPTFPVDGTQFAAGGMISGMRYGPKSNNAIERAREAAPNNPRVLLAQGISLYNTPSMWGGDTDDTEEATARLQEATNRFANTAPTDPLQPNWGHADAYAWLGIAHANDNRPREARAAFENALDVRPGYGWVQHVLMPELAAAE